jgi:cation transport ATPase
LTGLFLYLAFDRGTALHTYVFKLVRGWVSGLLPFFPYHRWVFSLGLVLIILVCFYLKFFKALPKETLKRALVSLGIYYLGFLLIERFGDDFAAIYSTNSFVFSILLTLGKTLEMSGLAAATYTLLKYLELTIPEISLEL